MVPRKKSFFRDDDNCDEKDASKYKSRECVCILFTIFFMSVFRDKQAKKK